MGRYPNQKTFADSWCKVNRKNFVFTDLPDVEITVPLSDCWFLIIINLKLALTNKIQQCFQRHRLKPSFVQNDVTLPMQI